MSRPLKIGLWAAGSFAALIGIAIIAALLILPSDWFREKVRAKLVSTVEQTTGGRVEIGSFHFDWKQMKAEVHSFVVHGTEPQGQKPLFRAESLQVGLKIISIWKKDVDIASLVVNHPEVNILIDKNGNTNLPSPKIKSTSSSSDPVQQILDLKIGELRINNGYAHIGDAQIPLDAKAENLNAVFRYDVLRPRYKGTVSMRQLTVAANKMLPMAFDFDSSLSIEANKVTVDSLRLALAKSYLQAQGEVANLKDPHAAFRVQATGDMAELGKPLGLPPPHAGSVDFVGRAYYSASESYLLDGKLTGKDLAVQQGGVSITNVHLASNFYLDPHYMRLKDFDIAALDGRVRGNAEVKEFRDFKASGNLEGFSLQTLARFGNVKNVAYSGHVSGPFEASGSLAAKPSDLKASAKLKILPAGGAHPVEGLLEAAYDQRGDSIQLGNSYVKTGATRLDITGVLGSHVHLSLDSRNLNDLLPAIAMSSPSAPKSLPLSLDPGGSAIFEGNIEGKLQDPQVDGNLTLTKFAVQSQKVNSFVTAFNANQHGARLNSFALGEEQLQLDGSAQIGLSRWKLVDASPVTAKVRLRNAQIGKLLASNGQKIPVDGLASATADLSGTYGNPAAQMQLTVAHPEAYGEKFDSFAAGVNYGGTGIEVLKGVLSDGPGRINLSGNYQHRIADMKNGTLQFNIASSGFSLEQINNLQNARPGMRGLVDVKAAGTVSVRNLEAFPNKIDGQVALRNLAVDNKALGNLSLDAQTQGIQLTLGAAGDLRGSKITGNGRFELAGDYPGSGSIQVSPMRFSTIQDLASGGTQTTGQPMPLDGVISANLTFSGASKKPELMRARLEVPQLELYPERKTQTALRQKQAADLTVRNAGPIVLEADGKGVHILSAKLVGRDTNLQASGTVNYRERAPWDLKVDGNLNLGILQDFQEGLISSGAATISASVRGTLKAPQPVGRMTLKDASLYLVDLPNGIDKANGTILFDQNRATIEQLTAQTGGGNVSINGFVGLAGGEANYHLQASGQTVRVRYEGVSITVNTSLTLTGTTLHSLLSGTVTVERAGFNPKTDFGSLLASTAAPISTPTAPNELLRGMQLDVRVESVPNLELSTSLANGLQAEADVHVHGTAARPSLSGRVNVNQGDVNFFGNKYTINRGEINFYNASKIEPVLDLDLETTVRGILVNIDFQGTLSKLNVSYRSDPPLQSNEIIALLAVGRAPGTSSELASSQTVANNNFLATGANSLLGQAVAAPVSGRLQRFFGVSKLKIDPLLTGFSGVPQARITIEQQISKDITLTYVTNLTQANQQVVRLEWALNRTVSLVAVREENGIFGLDFLYKRSFR